jgi:glutathione reductase (NADPH)
MIQYGMDGAAGWNVAIVDSLPFGGTCALRGCDPKKVLVEAAKIIDSNQRYNRFTRN